LFPQEVLSCSKDHLRIFDSAGIKKGGIPMTKREMMEQKVRAILREVMRMSEAISRMEKELCAAKTEPHRDAEKLINRCEELHARLEDIRNILEESRRLVEASTQSVEEPDLWL
jgi:anion-transporting  ArsA/GET3 family ATPase